MYVQISKFQNFVGKATIGHGENGKIAKKLVKLFRTLCFLVKTQLWMQRTQSVERKRQIRFLRTQLSFRLNVMVYLNTI